MRSSNLERVRAAASRLGYLADGSAQAMARGRSDSICLLAAGISDVYLSPIVAGVLGAAERLDVPLTFASTRGMAPGSRTLRGVLEQRPRAVIIAGTRTPATRHRHPLAPELDLYRANGGHVVLISQPGLPYDTVSVDNERGGADLAAQIAELGYRRPVIFAGERDLLTATERATGMLTAFQAAGIPVPMSHVIRGAFTRDGGYAAAGELLTRDLAADVVLTVNDGMAVGALARFREAGLDLPRDMAVCGYDDMEALRDLTPPLTTVHVPWDRVGDLALAMAIEGPSDGPRLEKVIPHPVIRQSTPPRPAA